MSRMLSKQRLLLSTFFLLSLAGCDKISALFNPSPKSSAKQVQAVNPPDEASVKKMPAETIPASSSVNMAQSSGNTVIKINNWTMSRDEFKERLAAVKEYIPDFNPKDKEARKFVAEEIVKQELLVEDAEKRGLGKNKDVAAAIEEFRRTVLVRELAMQLTKDAQVTDQEAETYYNENKKDFVTPGEWHVREIMADTEDQAKTILVNLLQGADFAQTAQQQSKVPSAAKGGDLGFVTQFEVPQMEDVVKVLTVGGVSSVFQGPKGFYIVKLEEKKGGEQKEFAELKEEIKSGMLLLKQQQAVLGYLDKLRQNASVEINEKLLED